MIRQKKTTKQEEEGRVENTFPQVLGTYLKKTKKTTEKNPSNP